MKLQADARFTSNAISAYGPGYVSVGGQRLTRTCLIGSNGVDPGWGPDTFEDLNAEHFAALVGLGCDVLLLGTGARQRFPQPALMRPVIEAGRSIEVMDTAAACRTYNIVLAEGRVVAAALLIE